MYLKFRQLRDAYAICRLPANAPVPQFSPDAPFTSISRSADELSIVCLANQAPQKAKCEGPWTCFKLEGPFPFSLTGILASFIDPLAEKGVSIFAISTFDTDYVLVKEEHAGMAREILQAAGHEFMA
jgi:hypothetical protein